jgi:PDZ domain-containing secreted protein
MNFKLNFISNSKIEKLLKKKLILVFIFNLLLLFFLISFVFSQNLKNYILKQIVNINDEKYIINSGLGKYLLDFLI